MSAIYMESKSDILKSNISIVRVVSSFYPKVGGSITHTIELAKKINPYLTDQLILAPKADADCSEFDNNLGVGILRIKYFALKKMSIVPMEPLVQILYSISVYNSLRNLKKPDIIHTHDISQAAYCSIIGKIFKIPVVGMLHGSTSAYSPINGMYETMLAKLFRPSHAFVLDDGSEAPDKFKKLWGDRVSVVYHAIDTELFKKVPPTKDILKKLKIENAEFIILSTSSLIAVKNIELAIESFKLFLESIGSNNVYFLIAGNGDQKNFLMNLVKNYQLENNVKFLGEISSREVVEFLSIADVVVATSLYSNMNRSVQEAMSCEKAVVAFDSGGTNRLINNMDNGILVKRNDIPNFAKSIQLIYNSPDLKFSIGVRARSFIVNERSWNKRIKQELEVYTKLLNTQRAN